MKLCSSAQSIGLKTSWNQPCHQFSAGLSFLVYCRHLFIYQWELMTYHSSSDVAKWLGHCKIIVFLQSRSIGTGRIDIFFVLFYSNNRIFRGLVLCLKERNGCFWTTGLSLFCLCSCSQLKFDRFILIILVDNNSDVGVKVRDVKMFVLLY